MAKLEKTMRFKIQGIETEVKNVEELKDALKRLEQELESANFGSPEFKELEKQVASARNEVLEFERGIEGLNPQRQTEAFVKLGEAIVGAFAIGSVIEEFGGKSQTVLELQAKAERALVAIQGARAIAEGVVEASMLRRIILEKVATVQAWLRTAATNAGTVAENAGTAARITAAVAQRLLNFAAAAFPYAIVLAGIVAIVALLGDWGKKTKEVTEQQKKLKEAQDGITEQREEGIKSVEKEVAGLRAKFEIAKNVNVSDSERRAAIKSINEQYSDYLPNLLSETASLREIEAAEIAATKAMAGRLILKQREEQIAEVLKVQIGLQREINANAKQIEDAIRNTPKLTLYNQDNSAEEELLKTFRTQTDNLEKLKDDLRLSLGLNVIPADEDRIRIEWQTRLVDDLIESKRVQAQSEAEINKILQQSNELADQYGAKLNESAEGWNAQRDAANNARTNILELLKRQAEAEAELARARADNSETVESELAKLRLIFEQRGEALKQQAKQEEEANKGSREAVEIVQKTFLARGLTLEADYANDREEIEKKYSDKAKAFIKQRAEAEQAAKAKLTRINEQIAEEGLKLLELEKDKNLSQQLEIIDKREAFQVAALEAEKEREIAAADVTHEQKLALLQLYEEKRAVIEKEAQAKRDEAAKADRDKTKEENLATLEAVLGSTKQIADSLAQVLSAAISAQLKTVDDAIAKSQEAIDLLTKRAEEAQNRINTVEEQLKDARGQRREYLLKLLESERKKEGEIIAQKQKAEAEREEMQKKRIALEKQQQKIEAASIAINAVLAGIQAAIAISKAAAGGKFGVDNIAYAVAATAALVAGFVAVKAAVKMEEGGTLPSGSAGGMFHAFAKMAGGGVLSGPSHKEGGIKGWGGFAGIEAEGGEFMVRKTSTAKNFAALRAINEDGGRTRFKVVPETLAEGGLIGLAARKLEAGGALPDVAKIESSAIAGSGIVAAIAQLSKENVAAIEALEISVSVEEIDAKTKKMAKIKEGARVAG